ncbi:GNAT family N-acetyltransferase [Fusobacterium sp. FSA-380-WT-2B]|uniref:GNAT family N-acetyltransferase n=1 Tax=Fusobacterium sp. FSA-380-WT-2B TaxID=2605786 RepID=UPI0012B2B98F|nr:GNAT family protein [Fusobacterium sp. FSA-380-WT-2B]MSS61445.1 GNAT family N-acetyltransferase [Fusobacterium sp. FSA-380-WT-2B]
MVIELKVWTNEDKEILKEMCNKIDRKYLSDRIPNPYKLEDAIWWLKYIEENEGKNGIFRAIVVDGKICGSISIEKRGDIYIKEGVLGDYLLTEYWGRGIMTKATEEICKLAFEKLDIIKIMATVFDKNIGSKRVIEKNGFKLEGIREKSIYKNGIIYDEYIYGKIK